MTFARAVSRMAAPDYALMRRVNRWRAPGWVRWWMIVSTRGGDGWFWVACGIALLASREPGKYAAIRAAALAAAMGILIFRCCKKLVGRRRPCALEPHCWAKLLPPDQFSFPSGHSITAFAVAVSLGLCYSPFLPPLLFCAFSIALSRIVLGMHFLTDVLVGSALGTSLGYLAFLLVS